MPRRLTKGQSDRVEIIFSGDLKARSSWRPIWSKDQRGKTLVAVTSEEIDPISWWPSKNTAKDMADSMRMSVIYPDKSTIISSMPKIYTYRLPGEFQKWVFFSTYSVATDQVGFHIGDFRSFKDIYRNESGNHPIEIFTPYSNSGNSQEKVEKIKNYFTFLEKYYGPYPYWANGFQWFDLPSVMQGEESSPNPETVDNQDSNLDQVLYRQLFLNWFGKSILLESPKDQWLFEALTVYTETLFIEHNGSRELAEKYLDNQRKNMGAPVLFMDSNLDNAKLRKQLGIKGAWFFHTLRVAIDNDSQWFQILKSFIEDYQHKPLNTEDFYTYMSWKLNDEYDIIFDQFLKQRKLPVFHYSAKKKGSKLTFSYRWEANDENFNLPIIVSFKGEKEQIIPTKNWQSLTRKGLKESHVKIESKGLFEVRKDK